MSILEPFNSVVALASSMAAQKVIAGEMDKFEAFEYANKLVDQMVESDEYKQERERVLSKYADIKNVKLGDRVAFRTIQED